MNDIKKEEEKSLNFIEEIVEEDLRQGKYKTILTRFPPEPNGYLHIGHAKSICLNFGLALKYGGKTNLRFDDTNPVTEDVEYVESIKEDVRWLGFQWANEFYASDYFEQIYGFAVKLIQKGLAYVDDSSSEEIASQKGTPTEPGRRNKFAERTVEENLQLFSDMREGKYKDGEKVLRARVDMASPNMQLRDPVIYRIKHAHHHRTGDKWCIYPMYDFAHGQSDSIENITHSICTLEFVTHRPLYDWFIKELEIFPSRQYEFARLNMTFTVMSKRKLLQLVNEKFVSGWDDPRMPTISGLRRRGYTPESIRFFAEKIGVQKRDNLIDVSLLEFCIREHLNKIALRKMVVFDPLKVVITNYTGEEILKSENNPEDADTGHREVPFS
ncbi:MAG: glutamine--tRNA ligase, partial [Bacteroidetes bacterium]|nr:glutamine--tRNA ligase [Bacteroidota bacterium]